MWQRFLCGLAALLVAGTFLFPSPAPAQTQATGPVVLLAAADDDTGGTEKGHPPPVAAYAAAVLFTIVVLVLICMPSRKG